MNEPAFPTSYAVGDFDRGLTKRELFAAMALQGLLANQSREAPFEGFASDSVRFADALIAELEKPR